MRIAPPRRGDDDQNQGHVQRSARPGPLGLLGPAPLLGRLRQLLQLLAHRLVLRRQRRRRLWRYAGWNRITWVTGRRHGSLHRSLLGMSAERATQFETSDRTGARTPPE